MADGDASRGTSRLSALVPRLLTAIVYAGVMLGTIFFGGVIGLGVVISIAVDAGCLRVLRHDPKRAPPAQRGVRDHRRGCDAHLLRLCGGCRVFSSVVTALLVASLIWHVAFRTVTTADTATTVFGALYVGFMLSFFVLIRELDWWDPAGTRYAAQRVGQRCVRLPCGVDDREAQDDPEHLSQQVVGGFRWRNALHGARMGRPLLRGRFAHEPPVACRGGLRCRVRRRPRRSRRVAPQA